MYVLYCKNHKKIIKCSLQPNNCFIQMPSLSKLNTLSFSSSLECIRGCAQITSYFLGVLKTSAPPMSSSWGTPAPPLVIHGAC